MVTTLQPFNGSQKTKAYKPKQLRLGIYLLECLPKIHEVMGSILSITKARRDACLKCQRLGGGGGRIRSSRSMSSVCGELEASLGYVKPWWEAGGELNKPQLGRAVGSGQQYIFTFNQQVTGGGPHTKV